jgi:phosphoribosyl 1,2-cyclic phosphodiesterase
MPLYISSINSGSNGNCYYIGNRQEAVLIDAGISCRETEKRMGRLGLSLSTVKAIFVSHEHGDHITGIPAISKKHRIPVYITPATLKSSNIPIDPELTFPFKSGEPVKIGGLKITAFAKKHDASDPHSFMVADQTVKVGIFTDLGICCDQLKKYFALCDAAFLESNYCADMLEKGNYPFHLKKRISGGHGHLSNKQALDLFQLYRGKQLKQLILSHLSKNNNDPELVAGLFNAVRKQTRITVASRYHEMPVLTVSATAQMAMF